MWSLQAALDGRSASTLGIGHFTIPPDVIIQSSDGLPSSNADITESAVRTIVVPHGITAVPRQSPIKARKRTPWHPSPEQADAVERGGTRQWFTDRLFVESKQANLPGACSTSAIVHAVVLIVAVLLLVDRSMRAGLTTPLKVTQVSLRMPVMELTPPAAVAPPATPKLIAKPQPRMAPAPARTVEVRAAAPLATPASIDAEPTTRDVAAIQTAMGGAEFGGAIDGVTGGVAGGVVGGVAGGTGSAVAIEPVQAPLARGPFRVGEGLDRPRKIKYVEPVYPLRARKARVGGNVLIEATIGVDGKVHEARVVNSIAGLDQAALDAVRQWEFEPSRLNGVAVAVTMVIKVSFGFL
jgi:periplasmic protein TonB